MCCQTRKPVIIKAYQLQKMKEKNFLRMDREIRLMNLLVDDEAIVQLYNVFEEGNYRYLIMEMCKGGDLFKAMLLRGGKMDEAWVCKEVWPSLDSTTAETSLAYAWATHDLIAPKACSLCMTHLQNVTESHSIVNEPKHTQSEGYDWAAPLQLFLRPIWSCATDCMCPGHYDLQHVKRCSLCSPVSHSCKQHSSNRRI